MLGTAIGTTTTNRTSRKEKRREGSKQGRDEARSVARTYPGLSSLTGTGKQSTRDIPAGDGGGDEETSENFSGPFNHGAWRWKKPMGVESGCITGW